MSVELTPGMYLGISSGETKHQPLPLTFFREHVPCFPTEFSCRKIPVSALIGKQRYLTLNTNMQRPILHDSRLYFTESSYASCHTIAWKFVSVNFSVHMSKNSWELSSMLSTTVSLKPAPPSLLHAVRQTPSADLPARNRAARPQDFNIFTTRWWRADLDRKSVV